MRTKPLSISARTYSDPGTFSNGTTAGALPFRLKPIPASISLVLPMFNESASVDKTLEEVLSSLERNFVDFEVIVVDDCSTDDCAAQVQRWTEKDSRIVLFRLSRNERFGGALRRGLAEASKDWIFYTDFDLPIDLDCFRGIWNELHEVDMITGYSSEIPKNLSWNAKLLSHIYNGLVQAAFSLPLRDINFGFKAMRKSVRDDFQLISRSPFVDAEMFIQAGRAGHTIREVPVPFTRRQMGVSRIRRLDVILWSIFDLVRTRLRRSGGANPRAVAQSDRKNTALHVSK